MLGRDLSVIANFLYELKNDENMYAHKELAQNAYEVIEKLRQAVNSETGPGLSITFPCADTMKCTICKKTVVKE